MARSCFSWGVSGPHVPRPAVPCIGAAVCLTWVHAETVVRICMWDIVVLHLSHATSTWRQPLDAHPTPPCPL